jgi:hypothetical protein
MSPFSAHETCLARGCRERKEAGQIDAQSCTLTVNLTGRSKQNRRCVDTEETEECFCRAKRARICNLDSEVESDSSDNMDSEYIGGIMSSRQNRHSIPRNRLRKLHVMLFNDTDQKPPPEFDGCLSWAKIILNHYYLVRCMS